MVRGLLVGLLTLVVVVLLGLLGNIGAVDLGLAGAGGQPADQVRTAATARPSSSTPSPSSALHSVDTTA
jgi:hypothetical protein